MDFITLVPLFSAHVMIAVVFIVIKIPLRDFVVMTLLIKKECTIKIICEDGHINNITPLVLMISDYSNSVRMNQAE